MYRSLAESQARVGAFAPIQVKKSTFFDCKKIEKGAKVPSHASVAQLVEHHLAKVAVVSSNLITRSTFPPVIRGIFFGWVLNRPLSWSSL